MFNITSNYFNIFNNKPPSTWVVHITRDFLTCYSCSYYSSMLGRRDSLWQWFTYLFNIKYRWTFFAKSVCFCGILILFFFLLLLLLLLLLLSIYLGAVSVARNHYHHDHEPKKPPKFMKNKTFVRKKVINPLMTNAAHHIETNQLICSANQLTGFYMMSIREIIWHNVIVLGEDRN